MYSSAEYLNHLNTAQREAVTHQGRALLVIAGAGSGKTSTLAHRVAHLAASGVDPARILLLTFTRRAAQEMTRRAQQIAVQATGSQALASGLRWSGTFHAMGNRLLRFYAPSLSLDPSFTLLDRADSSDLLDLLRRERKVDESKTRFPRKNTCMAIYSRVVGAQESVDVALKKHFPWCMAWVEELRELFRDYTMAKQRRGVLDYDDLILYWAELMREPTLAADVSARFDHVLVDEYQDVSALQAHIVRALKPKGHGTFAVGDDAQSIYSFRAAAVRHILDFPDSYDEPARVVTMEENYRSTQPILDAANSVIAGAKQRFTKNLRANKAGGRKPVFVLAEDEACQVDYVVESILEDRESGVSLMDQAVLFRTSHHADALEVELSRRQIPYKKFGGLKFLEAAHVKDMMAILRWAENPRDSIAGFRLLKLLPGVGPKTADRAVLQVEERGLCALSEFVPPSAAAERWAGLVTLLGGLSEPGASWEGQLDAALLWYQPLLEQNYDAAHIRAGDLDQLAQLSAQYRDREHFLSELTLDPPDTAGDLSGPPHRDEEYLTLSTIHSAKGQEWRSVYILNLADGCIPSDLATEDELQLDEERRLLYVGMTRAKDTLQLVQPRRFFVRRQHRHGDRYVSTARSRFLSDECMEHFETRARARPESARLGGACPEVRIDVAANLRNLF